VSLLERDRIKLTRSAIARSPCDEAIHAARAMDCRASLAMTATPQERLAMTDATTAAQCEAITA